MWLKKKSVLIAKGHYNSNTAFDGADWRRLNKTQTWFSSLTPPSAADAGNYFYLPALGSYDIFSNSSQLNHVGEIGNYWSSSAYPFGKIYAYRLIFTRNFVTIDQQNRTQGFRVGGFE